MEKVLTASSLIDAGKVTPNTKITVPPSCRSQRPGDPRLLPARQAAPDADRRDREVLQHRHRARRPASSRHQQLYDYLRKFGLGQRTGIGVHGESPGVLTDWHDWSQINQDTIAFGQGVAVNAVQMAAAVNTIANGGVYVQPSLVKGEATTSGGEVVGSDTTTAAPGGQRARRPADRAR